MDVITGEQLYFIAIMLPQAVDDEIMVFKNEIAARFNSGKALRTASHVTLKAPFKLPAVVHGQLLKWFANMDITVACFSQEIKDFGAFNNKYSPVIYAKPVMNTSLCHLQKEILQNFMRTFPAIPVLDLEKKFSPHITIAYRDLELPQFEAAWREYEAKQYHAAFEVNSFQLLQHINGRWSVVSDFLLPV